MQFHAELLNYIDIPVLSIHGKQKQQRRTAVFLEFVNAAKGVLLCTDVAARGLDNPAVDRSIPDEPRAASRAPDARCCSCCRRWVSGRGLTQEVMFLKYLRAAKVALNEYEFPKSKVANIQGQLTKLIGRNFYLHKAARDAYRSYIMAYASHSMKDIFNVNNLDLKAVALGFGFEVPPISHLSFVKTSGKNTRDNAQQGINGREKRAKTDGRQFSR